MMKNGSDSGESMYYSSDELSIHSGRDGRPTPVIRKRSERQSCKALAKRNAIVHVTFLKLGEINTLKEQFDADVLVRARWREPRLDAYKPGEAVDWENYWNPKLFIDNSVGEPKLSHSRNVEMNELGEAWVTERKRYKGTFMETLELWEFPFDVQDLSITVMTDLPLTEVEITEDPNEVHKIYKQSFIDEQEWYLYKYIESSKRELAKDRADPTVRRVAVTVRCRVARRPAYFIWNIFSVTLLIAALSFVTFAVDPDLVQNRLQLTFTLVLTTVAFKFVVNQSLPRISYLTYLDRYVTATAVILAVICFWHGLQHIILPDKADDYDYIFMLFVVVSYMIYNIQFLLRIYLVDRYVLATMVVLAGICLWHGLQRVIPDDHQDNDFIACFVFIAAYIAYNIQFIVRISLVPYKKRREMKNKETAYILLVREQAAKRRQQGKVDSDSESENQDTAPLTSIKTRK